MKAGIQRSTGGLVGIMVLIVAAGVLIARSYYGNLNRSVDPRVINARELYEQYDRITQTGDYNSISALLDSIAFSYEQISHYKSSFELGVIHNNRAAMLLTLALYGDSITDSLNPYAELQKDSIISLAENHVNEAIGIYIAWNGRFGGKGETEIRQLIETEFSEGLDLSDPAMKEKYLKNRVDEIEASLVENQRRLSVCHTNLGLVYRLRGQHTEAVAQYEKAIALWDRNLEAENNLNRLLGRPLKKRNIIQKLFPPNKDISRSNNT
jgi:tetratricopeptide (TPR) repeat protein